MTHEPSSGGALDEIAEELEQIERRSPFARTLVTVAITVVAVGLLIGVVLAVSVAMRDTRTAVNEVDVAAAPQVSIRSASADVTFVEGDGETVRVSAEVTSGIRETAYELRRRGDEIEVVSSCQTWLSPGCGVAVTIEVPAGLPVLVATGSGDVVADALTDRVLTVATEDGDVRGSGLVLDEIDARTGSGDVRLSFAEPPFAVKARTAAGDVDVMIPGDEGYDTTVRSDTGSVRSDVEDDADGRGFIEVRTDSGDVVLRRE